MATSTPRSSSALRCFLAALRLGQYEDVMTAAGFGDVEAFVTIADSQVEAMEAVKERAEEHGTVAKSAGTHGWTGLRPQRARAWRVRSPRRTGPTTRGAARRGSTDQISAI